MPLRIDLEMYSPIHFNNHYFNILLAIAENDI